MEPNDEVLVVIQAESGEEIALPLTALGEQHQEVVVDTDGITTIVDSQNENTDLQPLIRSNGIETNGEVLLEGDCESANVDLSQLSPVKKEPRIKQKRKEKLVCLPLFEDDLTLEFQTVEQSSPPIVEEVKKRPRKEYRTKRKLAALEPQKEQDASPKPVATSTPTPPPQPPTTTARQRTPTPTPVQPTPERRTRLSNACRVATGKLYKCNDCEFSTERINNIISHMKETCPKIKKEISA